MNGFRVELTQIMLMDKSISSRISKYLSMCILCLLVGFSSTASSGELNKKSVQKLKWQQGQSENITIYSDMHSQKVLSLLTLLEDFAAYCQAMLEIRKQDREFTMTLFVARKTKTWRALGENPLNVYRVRTNSHSSTAIVRAGSSFNGAASGPSPVRTRLYETVAKLQIRKSPNAKFFPLWYLDGMTRYLATYERKGDKVSVGKLNSVLDRLRTLVNATKQFEAFDLNDAFNRTVMPKRSEGEGSTAYIDRINQVYSLNLMLVHYFNANEGRRDQLNNYLILLAQGQSNEEAMHAATGMSVEELGKVFYRYLNSQKLYARTFSFDEVDSRIKKIQGDSFAVPKVERVEGSVVIASRSKLIHK